MHRYSKTKQKQQQTRITYFRGSGRNRGERLDTDEASVRHEHGDVRENTHGGCRLPVA